MNMGITIGRGEPEDEVNMRAKESALMEIMGGFKVETNDEISKNRGEEAGGYSIPEERTLGQVGKAESLEQGSVLSQGAKSDGEKKEGKKDKIGACVA
jgi:hypothetical protein